MGKNLIKIDEIDNISKEINEVFFDIPFGNSDFQTKVFAINGQLTPERAYRQVGLTLSKRLRTLKEVYYNLKREDINLEELKEKLEESTSEKSKFERQRIETDIDEKSDNRDFLKKLLNDSIREVSLLYSMFEKLPKFTRAEFEAGEKNHFTIRALQHRNGIEGSVKDLVDMGYDLRTLGVRHGGLESYDVVKDSQLSESEKLELPPKYEILESQNKVDKIPTSESNKQEFET